MSNFSVWFSKNKVLILGLLGSITVVLQQYFGSAEPADYKVVGFGVLLAALSFLAKNLQGQVASIVGVLGTAVGTIAATIQTGGKITWVQIILSSLVAIIGVITPAAAPKQPTA
jgi:hypothetical protein